MSCRWKLKGCAYFIVLMMGERFARLWAAFPDYSGMMPKATAASIHRMEKPQTYTKLALIWSLISTSARPVPSSVAGTIGLMKVAQLRQTTMATAMGSESTPKA